MPKGHRLGLTVRGKDIAPDDPPSRVGGVDYQRHANIGPFKHMHPQDRPAAMFEGTNALHFDGKHEAYLLLPLIP